MHRELEELLTVARVEMPVPAEFLDRLASIHARYLGSDADAPGLVDSRLEAVAAYVKLTRGIERHHQLELVARAINVEA